MTDAAVPPMPRDPIADLSTAPLPTAKTLKRRKSIPMQLVRFVIVNSRMMRMVLKGHH